MHVCLSHLRTLEHLNKAAIRDFFPSLMIRLYNLSDTFYTYMALMTQIILGIQL